ncbi:MAG: hypothetical protein KJ058_02115, partial [Thermoanaerobaculia bacterium]|nr:hypothetical protein [Thermoanaerobaculia bacterium]
GQDLVVRVADVDETRRRLSLTLLGTRASARGEQEEWRSRLEPAKGGFGTLGDFLRDGEKKPRGE